MKNSYFKLLGFSVSTFAALLLTSLVNPSTTTASGFALFTQGAKELGMENSVIAHTEGPGSNFYNPALLTQLDGTQLEIGTTLVFSSTDFRSDLTGESLSSEDSVDYPSILYMTYEVGQSLTLGLGINSTFGLSTEWPDDWEGRYIATKAELLTFNFNPNIAWKVSDQLSLAGGIDILYGDGTLENKMNLALFGLPDGHQKFEGDGDGYGFNLGLLYKISDRLSFGASYRSGIELDLEGKAKFDLPAGSPPALLASFPNAEGEATLDLPPQAFVGLAYKLTDNFMVEVGGMWEGWSSYERLKIDFDEPIAGSNSSITEKNWKDVWSFKLGAKYNMNPTLAFSAGYYHGVSPVPDHTFEPSIPDSDHHHFSLGIQKGFDRLTISTSYNYLYNDERRKNNLVGSESGLTANGEYQAEAHLVSISVTYAF